MRRWIDGAPVVASVALVAALAAGMSGASAQGNAAPEPMVLRGIMDQLAQDLQSVTGAISREDWKTVAELAPRIANHEEPPITEKVRILTWLLADAPKFRGLDKQVEADATAMGEAATAGDGQAVIASFAKVQQSCLACHQAYRQKFVEHFYAK